MAIGIVVAELVVAVIEVNDADPDGLPRPRGLENWSITAGVLGASETDDVHILGLDAAPQSPFCCCGVCDKVDVIVGAGATDES